MKIKPKNMAVCAILVVCSVLISFSSHAVPYEKVTKGLSGCYKVKRGHYEISRTFFNMNEERVRSVVGEYRIVLVKKSNKKKSHKNRERHVFKGPLFGQPYQPVAGGFVTRHIMGTFDRTGTLTSNEDPFVVNSASCLDNDGNPQFVTATETFIYDNPNQTAGTGRFSNIESGFIEWVGTVNSCDDPNNGIGDFEVANGEMCFK